MGVFNGCFYNDPNYSKTDLHQITTQVELHQLKGEITAFVVDDPDAVFLMECRCGFCTEQICLQTILLLTLTGVQQTGISKECNLDVSVQEPTATLQFKQLIYRKIQKTMIKQFLQMLTFLLESTITFY